MYSISIFHFLFFFAVFELAGWPARGGPWVPTDRLIGNAVISGFSLDHYIQAFSAGHPWRVRRRARTLL